MKVTEIIKKENNTLSAFLSLKKDELLLSKGENSVNYSVFVNTEINNASIPYVDELCNIYIDKLKLSDFDQILAEIRLSDNDYEHTIESVRDCMIQFCEYREPVKDKFMIRLELKDGTSTYALCDEKKYKEYSDEEGVNSIIIVGNKEYEKEHNFRISKNSEHDYLVRSDSRRFGLDGIVYEGISYNECLDYIQRHINPKVSYFVVDNFSKIAEWTMSNEQKEARKELKSSITHVNSIEEAVDLFKQYSNEKDLTDAVINKNTGNVVPEVAVGVCINGTDVCDILYNSAEGIVINTDFIAYTHSNNDDEHRLANIKKFIDDMTYAIEETSATKVMYIRKGRAVYDRADKNFFKELPTLRNDENIEKIRKDTTLIER